MNDTWYYLREFESSDLITRYIKRKYGYNVQKSKAHEIASAFAQGREFFRTSQKSDLSVMPILQYYGVLALSRGLILILRRDKRESSIKPSHGLTMSNWDGCFPTASVTITNGTFLELIRATENESHFRSNCSGVNWTFPFPEPKEGEKILLKNLSWCFPDLHDQVSTWLLETPPRVVLQAFHLNGELFDIKVSKAIEPDELHKICPPDSFSNAKVIKEGDEHHLILSSETIPNLTQRWVYGSHEIGDVCICPPLSKELRLNLISTMFAVSNILSTVSRYNPSVWQNVIRGMKNDSILPFIVSMLDLIAERYPITIKDHLKAPYKTD